MRVLFVGVVGAAGGEKLFVVVGVNVGGENELTGVIEAIGAIGIFFGAGKRRQEKGRENGDDRDDDEEFD